MGTILFFVLFFEKNRIFLDFIVWRRRLLKHKDFFLSSVLGIGSFLGGVSPQIHCQRVFFGYLKAQNEGVKRGKNAFFAVPIKLGLFCNLLIYY